MGWTNINNLPKIYIERKMTVPKHNILLQYVSVAVTVLWGV